MGGFDDSQSCVLISENQFKVIRQLTYQLCEYEERLLASKIAAPGELSILVEFVDSFTNLAGQALRVRIVFGDAYEVGSVSGSTLRPVLSDLPGSREAVGELSGHLISSWLRMMQYVVSLLEGRELFLRTGYDLDEVRGALEEFEVDRS
ncbi:hypothetical protein [Amycolatopsis lurida]|uniref:hypothetical protein n=1 Tax=Amycolatopsis lurida TaxID=31959 RepID=UPI00115F8431|nr:hypothetical protein [Amycolatopsis lurida]